MSPFGIIKRSLVMAPHGGISMESRVEKTLKELSGSCMRSSMKEGARQKLASACHSASLTRTRIF